MRDLGEGQRLRSQRSVRRDSKPSELLSRVRLPGTTSQRQQLRIAAHCTRKTTHGRGVRVRAASRFAETAASQAVELAARLYKRNLNVSSCFRSKSCWLPKQPPTVCQRPACSSVAGEVWRRPRRLQQIGEHCSQLPLRKAWRTNAASRSATGARRRNREADSLHCFPGQTSKVQ
jgi:hypothetical protein